MAKRIIYQTQTGEVIVIIPAPDCGLTVEEIAAKDVPQGAAYDVVDVSDLPVDRMFRNAWEKSGNTVIENLSTSKSITHEKRRAKRAEEFAPLDVQATIPAQAAEAEAARRAIRNDYAVIQAEINAAADVLSLKAVVSAMLARP